MKKKLLVLMLVLGMVSAAPAVVGTIDITTGASEYDPDEVVTVTIVTSSAFNGAMGNWLGNVDFDVTVSETGTDASGSVGTLITSMKVGLGWSEGSLGTKPLLIDDVKGRSAMSSGVQGGVTIYTFSLDVGPDAGTIVVGLSNVAGWSPFSAPHTLSGVSKELTVVPEPMTIALLGLGGLFLRRRK